MKLIKGQQKECAWEGECPSPKHWLTARCRAEVKEVTAGCKKKLVEWWKGELREVLAEAWSNCAKGLFLVFYLVLMMSQLETPCSSGHGILKSCGFQQVSVRFHYCGPVTDSPVKSRTPPGAHSPVGQMEDQKGNVRKLMGITLCSNSYNILCYWHYFSDKSKTRHHVSYYEGKLTYPSPKQYSR